MCSHGALDIILTIFPAIFAVAHIEMVMVNHFIILTEKYICSSAIIASNFDILKSKIPNHTKYIHFGVSTYVSIE